MILLLESLHPDAEALLEAAGPVLRAVDPNQAPDDLTDLTALRAILTRGRGRISKELLARCPSLEVIARAGAGLDNLDTKEAAARGIPVIFAPGANASTVAEHTLALMLDLVRGVSLWTRRTSSGGWEQRGSYQGAELRGLTLGIIGLGSIGRRVADLARAFGMQVIAAQLPGRPREVDAAADHSIERLPLEALLAVADVVSLHIPLTPSTRAFFGNKEFGQLKAGAWLINTARGELIDGAALRAALATSKLGGFAADVLDVEPPSADDPLLSDERVVLTPHVASLTGATYRELCVSTTRNVVHVLRGESPEARSVFQAAE